MFAMFRGLLGFGEGSTVAPPSYRGNVSFSWTTSAVYARGPFPKPAPRASAKDTVWVSLSTTRKGLWTVNPAWSRSVPERSISLATPGVSRPKRHIFASASAKTGDETPRVPSNAEAIVNSLQTMPPRSSVSKSLEGFKGKVSLQEFALVFRELSSRGEWHLAWRLFKYMQRQSWCAPNEHIYTIMIGIMGREKMLDKCLELFDGMPANGVEWNVYSFTALINAYGRNGRYDVSLDLLARMRREGVAPNLITYNSVLNACSKGSLPWAQLLQVFGLMREDGVQPDSITFSTLLAACATRNLVVEAGSVFRTMVRSGVVPDQLAYATVIDIFRRGGRLGIVRMLLQEMVQSPAGPQPDAAAYTMLIDAYGMEGEYAAAEEVFDDLVAAGVTPSVATFTSLLRALGRCGHYEGAQKVMLRMKGTGATPDLATYHTLIQVFTGGGFFREAVALFGDMVEGAVEPTQETYTLLLTACGQGGLSSEADAIYRHMRECRVGATPGIYVGLISAHGNAARYADALAALHDAINEGVTYERGPFHAMMEAYARAGMPDDAAFIYALMLQEGRQHPEPSCGGATRGGDWGPTEDEVAAQATPRWGGTAGAPASEFGGSAALAEYQREQRRGQGVLYATNETFNLLITAFCRAGQYEEALSIRDDMLDARRSPDEATYAAMVSVYCGVGHYEAALAQVLEIKEDNILPPLSCYFDLLTLCARRGRWRTVRSILEEMAGVRRLPEYSLVREVIMGTYADGNWEVVEEAFNTLKPRGVAVCMGFFNGLLDVLWAAGLKSTAARVLQSALSRGLFPEAVRSSATLWALDLHRLSPGAAAAAVYVGMDSIRRQAESSAPLPPLYTIVLKPGTGSPPAGSKDPDSFPSQKLLQETAKALQLPFSSPSWHPGGRLVAARGSLTEWILDTPTGKRLQLSDARLPPELVGSKR